jgi:hypothetical protein
MKFVQYSLLARKQIQPLQMMAYGMLLQAIAHPNVFHLMNNVHRVFTQYLRLKQYRETAFLASRIKY